MNFIATDFADAWLIEPKAHKDHRGFFVETYTQRLFSEQGITATFVQDNHSCSVEKGVLRGLHFQHPPMAQAKLIRSIKGSIYDVIVDIRAGSPTYGRWQGFTLSATNFRMLLVPAGFAHGFCTLEPDTEIVYKVDNYYSPVHDSGIRWNDPTLNIPWPSETPILSVKDQALGLFAEFKSPFTYGQ